MPEISHVRIVAPDQAGLNRILRELGAQSFPQWMYAEPGEQARILWWGVRAAPVSFLHVPAAAMMPASGSFLGRSTTGPRRRVASFWATVDVERAKVQTWSWPWGSDWHEVGDDRILGAHCWRMTLDRSELVLAEPIAEGYTAACLARLGEELHRRRARRCRPDRTCRTRRIRSKDGRAINARIGPGTSPTLIFLLAR